MNTQPEHELRENAMNEPISLIVPALNESEAIADTIKGLQDAFRYIAHEVIVVDDGSSDGTGAIAETAGARVVRHPEPGGYGLALKAGIRAARHDLLAIVDADSTYPLDAFPELYKSVTEGGYDMSVGARTGRYYTSSTTKTFFRRVLKFIVEFSSGRRVPDVNSGMRVFRKSDASQFLPTLSNTFSFTTSITLAYMINGLFIKYVPVGYFKRSGDSKVHHLRDSLRALQLIVHSVIFYNPIKLFLILASFAVLLGLLSLVCAQFDQYAGLLLLLTMATALIVISMGCLAVGLTHISIILRNESSPAEHSNSLKPHTERHPNHSAGKLTPKAKAG